MGHFINKSLADMLDRMLKISEGGSRRMHLGIKIDVEIERDS